MFSMLSHVAHAVSLGYLWSNIPTVDALQHLEVLSSPFLYTFLTFIDFRIKFRKQEKEH